MNEVSRLLANPAIKAGLKLAAPEVSLGLDIVAAIFGATRKPKVEQLYAVVDRELANVLKSLATTKSKVRRRELEIRAHTILGIILEWDKIRT